MKYPYAETIHMISTEWSLTHLFLLNYMSKLTRNHESFVFQARIRMIKVQVEQD